MDADVITFEASRADLKILDALKKADFQKYQKKNSG